MRKEKNSYKHLVGKPEGRDSLEELGIDGRITIKWVLKGIVLEDVEWINLAQDRNKCQAVVNTTMNFRVP
jgi:hypothetical protein